MLSSLLVFYLVFFSTYADVKGVDNNLIASVKLMGDTKLQVLYKVTLPSCVPWILSGIRGGLGASLIGAIVGEYMGASAGLGWMISYATSFFKIQRVMSCIFILLLIGISFNFCLKVAEGWLLRWRPNASLNTTNEEAI
ncbi:ABC transporter permease [Alkaliphilus pronyensis]|uniref:ABC transporter permease n=1 Tax=Alkaliphilus pronyensis TaxID=1482732 RepID=UPI001FAA3B27|nr:ABC transporter permease subunit [Alkaliphilus pronyensis]